MTGCCKPRGWHTRRIDLFEESTQIIRPSKTNSHVHALLAWQTHMKQGRKSQQWFHQPSEPWCTLALWKWFTVCVFVSHSPNLLRSSYAVCPNLRRYRAPGLHVCLPARVVHQLVRETGKRRLLSDLWNLSDSDPAWLLPQKTKEISKMPHLVYKCRSLISGAVSASLPMFSISSCQRHPAESPEILWVLKASTSPLWNIFQLSNCNCHKRHFLSLMKPWLHLALWSLRSSQKKDLLTHSIKPSSLCLFLLRMEPVSSSGGLASATFQGLLVFSQWWRLPVWLSKVTDLSICLNMYKESKTHAWPQGIATTKEHDMSSICRAAHGTSNEQYSAWFLE